MRELCSSSPSCRNTLLTHIDCYLVLASHDRQRGASKNSKQVGVLLKVCLMLKSERLIAYEAVSRIKGLVARDVI